MKNKRIILTCVGVVLGAALLLFSIAYVLNSQRELDKGLWEACERDDAASVSHLLGKGANVDAIDEHGVTGIKKNRTALHMCAHFVDPETVRLLLLAGANPNALDDDGRTPLFFAGSGAIAKELLFHGADLSREDSNGETALEARLSNGWYMDEALTRMLEGKGRIHRSDEK